MHTIDIELEDGQRAHVHFNGDFSGEATLYIPGVEGDSQVEVQGVDDGGGVEVKIETSVLLKLAGHLYATSVRSQLIGIIEDIDLAGGKPRVVCPVCQRDCAARIDGRGNLRPYRHNGERAGFYCDGAFQSVVRAGAS